MRLAQSRQRRANIFDLQPLEVRRFLTTASITANNTLTITGTGSGETITVNRNSSNRVAITGVSATFVSGSGSGQFNKIVINAQGGSDTITISGNVGSSIPSTINAGDGNDVIATGLGDDVIFGQNGFDTVNYSARTSKVTVSLDGAQNDGETQNGESDNVNAEEVLGGSGNDVFTGNSSANYFTGGAGNDEIATGGGNDELVGNTGGDALFGEGGDDALYAKNNDVDTVNGGTGPGTTDLDLAEVDGVDVSGSFAAAFRAHALAIQIQGFDPAALDTTYGGNDTGTNAGPPTWGGVTAATVDSQGRVVLVGYAFRNHDGDFSADFAVTRYNADGTWDEDFGEQFVDFGSGSGYSDDDIAQGVTTDADDNIIIVGTSRANTLQSFDEDVAVVRFSSAGDFDTDFGLQRFDVIRSGDSVPGNVDDVARDVVVQDDGKIVVVGTHDLFGADQDIVVLRLDEFGDLDANFGGEGTGMATFDIDGTDEDASSVALQTLPDDEPGVQRIVVGGVSGSDFLVVRFNADGTLDNSFNGDIGYQWFDINDGSIDVLNDVAVNADNEIVAVGQSYFAVITFALEPSPLDPSARGAFAHISADGSTVTKTTSSNSNVSYNAVTFDDDGNVVVAGSDGADYLLARYTPSFEVDGSFNDGELVFTDITPPDTSFPYRDWALGVGVVDGKIIVGGQSLLTIEGPAQPSVARYGVSTDEGPVDEVDEVTDFLSYDDVQNDPGTNRSSTATFYLKSTHLDDEGNAIINLTDGNDTARLYTIIAENGDEQVVFEYNGLFLYFDQTTTSITINCKKGNDSIIATDDVLIPLIINGNEGIDVIRGGGANDIIRGGDGLDVLGGGAGNDVILGEAGIAAIAGLVDLISGDAGNDILIGGTGPDALNGGADEDILIGGTTAFDGDNTALSSLVAEWGDTSKTNADRVFNLRNGGGLNGTNVLVGGTTVFNDNVVDLYTGGSGRDWFFRRVAGNVLQRDTILDNSTGEELTIL